MHAFEVSMFDEYVPLDINVNDYYNDVVGIARLEGEPQLITFHVEKSELPYLQTRPIHHSQKIVSKDNPGVNMTISVIPNTELTMELMSYGDGITVKTKGKLRNDIKKRLRSSLKKYGSLIIYSPSSNRFAYPSLSFCFLSFFLQYPVVILQLCPTFLLAKVHVDAVVVIPFQMADGEDIWRIERD